MTVILRAFLVVGVLTYFAAQQRPGGSPVPGHPSRSEATNLSAAWDGLQNRARDEIAREAGAEVTRRLSAAKASQDTLLSSDRRPAWRGTIE